jgi:hypothetical protein
MPPCNLVRGLGASLTGGDATGEEDGDVGVGVVEAAGVGAGDLGGVEDPSPGADTVSPPVAGGFTAGTPGEIDAGAPCAPGTSPPPPHAASWERPRHPRTRQADPPRIRCLILPADQLGMPG